MIKLRDKVSARKYKKNKYNFMNIQANLMKINI